LKSARPWRLTQPVVRSALRVLAIEKNERMYCGRWEEIARSIRGSSEVALRETAMR